MKRSEKIYSEVVEIDERIITHEIEGKEMRFLKKINDLSYFTEKELNIEIV
jgi:hypothetical protein